MASIDNLDIGIVQLYFDLRDGEGERDLGHTLDGANFIFEREFTEIKADKYSSPIDLALKSNNLKVKVKLAEPTTLNLSTAIPEGDYDVEGSDSKLGLGRDTGYKLRQRAGLLRLHPIKNTADSRDEDVYIWYAVSVENIDLGYKVDDQRAIEITFQALINEDYEDGTRLGRVGDIDIS